MGKIDQIKQMTANAKNEINKALANVPVANRESILPAHDLAKKALGKIQSCQNNYNSRRYPEAAEDLQQSVEKAAKALGLLLGNLKPTDDCLKEVSHDSYMAMIIDFESSYPKIIKASAAVFEEISLMDILDNFLFRKFASTLRESSKQMLESISRKEQRDKELEELKRLKKSEMWKASLELDESNKWIKEAMEGIRQPVLFGDTIRSFISLGRGSLKLTGIFDKETIQKMRLSASLGKGGEKMFPLCIITCWHYEPSKYPSLGNYWKSDAYKIDAPFVKEMPVFIRYCSKAVDGLVDACNSNEQIMAGNDDVIGRD